MYFPNNDNCIFSDLQAFGDFSFLMHTSGNNEHYEHELEYNKRCIMQLLFVLSCLYIFDVHFNCMLCPNTAPNFFIFCVCNALLLNYMGYESNGNGMKAIGGVTTFVHLRKM